MEYKYHPVLKHLTYFIIIYLFLRHQKLMNNEILLINSIILTLFIIILDHVFILGHLTPFDSLADQYFNKDEIIDLKEEINKEERRKRREQRREKRREKRREDDIFEDESQEDKSKLQLTNDGQVVNELKFIKNNKPNKFNDTAPNHSEFVNITNNLDNYEYDRKSNNNNNNRKEDYTDFLAYNE